MTEAFSLDYKSIGDWECHLAYFSEHGHSTYPSSMSAAMQKDCLTKSAGTENRSKAQHVMSGRHIRILGNRPGQSPPTRPADAAVTLPMVGKRRSPGSASRVQPLLSP
jgi:hypothetical protein